MNMTRLERRMQDALSGNAREVLEKYNAEIAAERERKAARQRGIATSAADTDTKKKKDD